MKKDKCPIYYGNSEKENCLYLAYFNYNTYNYAIEYFSLTLDNITTMLHFITQYCEKYSCDNVRWDIKANFNLFEIDFVKLSSIFGYKVGDEKN